MRRFRLAHHLKTSLWLLPVLMTALGVAVSLVTVAVDDGGLVSRDISGDPDAARQVLYLIAFATLTLTGIVLSLVVLAVQLAMGTFSPRIVRQILQDRPSQLAIGLLAGTFAHALLAMRAVRAGPGDGSVPGLAVLVALGLALACVAALVWYLNHITQSLRTAALVGWVADDTITAMRRVMPTGDDGPPGGDPGVVHARRGGVLFELDADRLVRLATRAGVRIELLAGIGEFVPTGAPVARVVGDDLLVPPKAVLRCLMLGPERTLNEDVAYGLRMLVDIAERSLSAGPFQDPTTAVQAVDRIHDVLRQLGGRHLPDGRHHDDGGTLRLTVPTLGWSDYVRLAFDEVRLAGAGSPQVSRRLAAALRDLLSVAPPQRRGPLLRQLELLRPLTQDRLPTHEDRSAAVVPDLAGLGAPGRNA